MTLRACHDCHLITDLRVNRTRLDMTSNEQTNLIYWLVHIIDIMYQNNEHNS